MAAQETPTALGPCPTDEDIAAFLEGALTAEERARITAHLADCESCYEIFAGAVHLETELGEASAPEHPPGTVVSFPVRKRERRAPRPWWIAAATAAVLAVAIGIPLYRSASTPPKVDIAEQVALLTGRPGVQSNLQELRIVRGGEKSEAIFSGSPSFLIGVFEVDLRLSFAATDATRSERFARKVGLLIRDVDSNSKVANDYLDSANQLSSGKALGPIAATEPARSTAIGTDPFVLPESVDFGTWTEAGRLAAATQIPDFFATRENRRFLSFLLKGRFGPLDPSVEAALRRVEAIWDRGQLQPADFAALAKDLGAVIDRYEALLAEDEARQEP